jgi:transcriptional regulator with XRE-family HTH domain
LDSVKRIKKLLEENGITAKKMLIELGLSTNAVSEWNKGKAKPSFGAIVKISEYFNVSTDYLLCKTDAPSDYGESGNFPGFAKRLNYYIDVLKFDISKIAELAKASVGQVELWRNDKRAPNAKNVGYLAENLSVSTDYLYGYTDDPTQKSSEAILDELPLTSKQRKLISSLSEESRRSLFDFAEHLASKQKP